MKTIGRILKRRWVLGTLVIFAVGIVLGIIFNKPTLAGNLLPFWWIFCFITRNRKRKEETPKTLIGE